MRSLLLALMLVHSSLFAAEPPKPRPTDAQLQDAEKEVLSIYGPDIKATNLPQKAKLAKEMLKVALDTTNLDPERFILCQWARGLAVASGDKPTAFAASIAIAERFEPPADSHFTRAQDLWRAAAKANREIKLQKQAEAIEWYVYARASAKGLEKIIIEKRLNSINEVGDKTIIHTKPVPGPKVVYLDDIQELSSYVGWGRLGKHGETSRELGIAKHDHALVAMPSSNGSWHVAYQLDSHFSTFSAFATLEATPHHPIALAFKVFGDKKLLWRSKPLTKAGESEQCDVSVKKVRVLELQVECPGSNDNAHAAWVDPCLSK